MSAWIRRGAGSHPRLLLAAAMLSLVVGVALRQTLMANRSDVSSAAHALPARGLATLPSSLRGAVSAAIGADDPGYFATSVPGGGLAARTPAEHLSSSFAPNGVTVRSHGARLSLGLRGVGYGVGALSAVPAATPRAQANRVVYSHGAISEWYANGPLGLEQGFTVSRPPAGGEVGPLTLELSLSSSAPAVVAPGGKGFTVGQPGDGALAYTGLAAVDARGRLLPSHLRVAGGRLLLTVDAAGATYPLKVDPFVQQGAPLTGSGATGNSRLGASVALSANGNTALVGGNFDNSDVGAAWVFTRSGETWTQQGSKLTGSGEVGLGRFGSSVALSADGNTALIGGWADNTSVGAAWVFTRSGSSWSQQGPKLTGTGEVGAGRFGMGVSLSASGNTALIGGNHDNADEGAAWVFTREAETWSQQGSKLTPTGAGSSEASFGTSVALSGEGNTALIGAPTDNDVGSAWVFVLSEGAWSQQGGKLTGSGAEESALFGGSVAISGDGNTALVGGSGEASESGAAWVFARSGSVWSQQGERVTGSGETGAGLFGQDVALSSEGNTALIGGPSDNEGVGAAWVFQRSGEAWGQAGGKLTVAEGEPEIGSAVALSANATTALVGARFAHSGAGAAYVYASGSHAPTAITGTATNLTGSSAVLNGTVDPNGEEVTSCEIEWGFTMSYEHSVPCTPSPGSGEVNVAVSTPLSGLSETTYHFRVTATNESGTSSGKDETFKPEHGVLPTLKKLSVKKGPATGRTLVTITGAGFVAPVSVSFGGVEGIEAHLVSSTSITVATPPGTSGDAAVTVTTPNGTSAESPKFQFKYGLPTVTKVTPSKGAYAGGTVTTISGSGFAIGSSTELEFEKVPGTAVNCSSTSECTVTTPPASKKIKPATGGGANVIAVVGKSKSKKNPPADEFVYEAS